MASASCATTCHGPRCWRGGTPYIPRAEVARLSERARALLRYNPIVDHAHLGEEAYQAFAY